MPVDTANPVIPDRAVVLAAPDGSGEPMTVTAAVLTVEHRSETGIHGRMIGLEAHLRVLLPGATAPDGYFLSRLVGEPWWVQDSHFGPTGFPYFSHGFGARYMTLRGIDPALEALLDEAARTRGLAAEIGPDTPLVLPTPYLAGDGGRARPRGGPRHRDADHTSPPRLRTPAQPNGDPR